MDEIFYKFLVGQKPPIVGVEMPTHTFEKQTKRWMVDHHTQNNTHRDTIRVINGAIYPIIQVAKKPQTNR